MNAPTAVRRKAEEADALITQSSNTPAAVEATPDANEATPAKVETPDPKDQASTQDQDDKQLTKPLGEEHDAWETKYQILQGKYNKEVPALHKEIRSLKESAGSGADSVELNRLKDENTTLKTLLKDQPNPITAPGLDELREEYSSELVDGLLNAMKGMVDPLQHKVDQVGESVKSANTNTTLDRLKQMLAKENIDFDRVNNDPLFVDDWLSELDAYSGVSRNDLLQKAFNSGDIDRAARFFTDYVGATHQTNSSSAANTLEKHVTVPSSAGDSPVDTGTSVWNDETIAQFYRDVADGKKYSPEEAAKLEAELFTAMGAQT